MNNCKSCRRELNAINMSDIEPEWCITCVETKLETIHPIEEEPEFYGMTDIALSELSRQLWPFPGTPMYPSKTNFADHRKPNPVDPRLDYIRKSLTDYEYEISAIKNIYTQE